MKKNVIVDLNNVSFNTRHKVIKGSQKGNDFVKEFIFREVVNTVVRTASYLKADGIVITSDSKNIWRKDIYPSYKSNRTGAIDDPFYSDTLEAIDMVKEFFKTQTAAYVLSVPRVEADDIIAYWCQLSNQKNVIVSTDKDFIQLINDDVQLYNMQKREYRTTEDPGFELFLKCIRGDSGDAIRSAYPRVRTKKLQEAWEDDYKLLNVLETVRKDGVKVAEVFDLNRDLIDLTRQPDWVRTMIHKVIEDYEPSKYTQLGAIKYMADVGLKNTSKIFEYHDRSLRTPPVLKE